MSACLFPYYRRELALDVSILFGRRFKVILDSCDDLITLVGKLMKRKGEYCKQDA